ncbi:hypothetical protein [Acidiferrobacter sp.]|uniref:hypothetical protein n=1 Tax=Acidiferrobacter sp. TaxID=1872107 RepID=UPI00260E6D3F|nr:hypothetical protein [Acidiferrobacter sp.]
MKPPKTRQALEAYLAARPRENAFVCAEFVAALAPTSYSSIARALAALVREGVLVKVGYGVYVRAAVEEDNGKRFVYPACSDRAYARELLIKLGISPGTDSVTRAYNEDRSTQVPAWLAYDVGRSRIVRKIGFGKRVLQYERSRG